MRIAILIPSEGYRTSAGVRIRYARLAAAAEPLGAISLHDAQAFDSRRADCDVFIVSKCFDARSLVLAEAMSRRGAAIGVDLFDDYFSQQLDSRLGRYRTWLRQMLSICDFALCSTQPLADVVRSYREGLATHVVSDPAPHVRPDELRQLLDDKRRVALEGRRLRICWFGIGDNPLFPVGISDAAAFGPALQALQSTGSSVELSILTNARALNAGGLAAIARIPVPTSVGEWSQAAEAAALRRSIAVFLPVNAQPFSIAKSLNRAATALAAGCQILTAGYPLYQPLDEFLYREPRELADDLMAGSLKLRAETLQPLEKLFEAIGSADAEAASLVEFLKALPRKAPARKDSKQPLLLLHGMVTSEAAHRAVRAEGGLSVALPYTNGAFDFDAVFRARGGREPALLLSRQALSRARPEVRRRARSAGAANGRKLWQIGGSAAGDQGFEWADPPVALQLAQYQELVRSAVARLREVFGEGRVILSELATLPFEAGS